MAAAVMMLAMVVVVLVDDEADGEAAGASTRLVTLVWGGDGFFVWMASPLGNAVNRRRLLSRQMGRPRLGRRMP